MIENFLGQALQVLQVNNNDTELDNEYDDTELDNEYDDTELDNEYDDTELDNEYDDNSSNKESPDSNHNSILKAKLFQRLGSSLHPCTLYPCNCGDYVGSIGSDDACDNCGHRRHHHEGLT